ncbi:MAG TPA: hypothetical protein VNN08_25660 [Thermoanaerobaculia bacterium]|nr:hypothetical protein [Thermoanaerobaculia bacterium]
MPRIESNPETLTRSGAIDLLRAELMKLAGDDASICKIAAEKNIFCRGLHRHSDAELRRQFPWISAKNPRMPRAEMEDLLDRWQLARQEVDQLPTACDVQQREHDGCRGWDDFSDEELSRFCLELAGRKVVVAAQPPA